MLLRYPLFLLILLLVLLLLLRLLILLIVVLLLLLHILLIRLSCLIITEWLQIRFLLNYIINRWILINLSYRSILHFRDCLLQWRTVLLLLLSILIQDLCWNSWNDFCWLYSRWNSSMYLILSLRRRRNSVWRISVWLLLLLLLLLRHHKIIWWNAYLSYRFRCLLIGVWLIWMRTWRRIFMCFWGHY
jgi:hypothetical protein